MLAQSTALSKLLHVKSGDGSGYWVINEDKGTLYFVSELDGNYSCDCPDYRYNLPTHQCKHILAVKAQFLPAVIAPDCSEDLFREHLSTNQKQLYDAALKWWEQDKENKPFTIAGFAGTGKTFTAQKIAQKILSLIPKNGTVALCAPTNKAKRILIEMAEEAGLSGYHVATIHSLLHLRPAGHHPNGEQRWIQKLGGSPFWADFDLVIADESSMLGSEILEFIPQGTPTIFMGDPAQLPPITKGDQIILSPVFNATPEVELTEVMRYEGAIAEYVTELRQDITRRLPPELPHKGNIKRYRRASEWEDSLIEYATENPATVRAIAWTNSRVLDINQTVREAVHPDIDQPFVAGEQLVAKEPISVFYDSYFGNFSNRHALTEDSDSTIVLMTSQECIVESVQEGKVSYGDVEADAYILKVNDGDGQRFYLPMIHDGDMGRIEKHFVDFRRQILGMESSKRGPFWKLFYDGLDRFNLSAKGNQLIHRLQYCYAVTVHASQGSTYQKVFVDGADIYNCRKPEMRNRLLYVAYSRASQDLHVRLRG